MNEAKKGFKGFTKDWKCKDHQFEIGKEYTHTGDVELCHSGYHYVENPLDVFSYYAPSDSKYAEIEADGVSESTDSDSKRVCKRITIKAEISIKAMVEAAIKFVFDKADWSKKETQATGNSGAASATGYRGAASATGDSGAASATGKEGCAASLGVEGKASGAIGCWLTLAEWEQDKEYNLHRIDVQTKKVDGKKIKADVFYMLVKGEFVEVK